MNEQLEKAKRAYADAIGGTSTPMGKRAYAAVVLAEFRVHEEGCEQCSSPSQFLCSKGAPLFDNAQRWQMMVGNPMVQRISKQTGEAI